MKITAELTNQLIGQIDSSKLIEIKAIKFVLACEILNDKEKERIAPVITMKAIEKEEIFQGYLTKEEKQEYIEKGEKIGEKVKEEEIVKNLIKLGQTPEFIAKATNMDKKQIMMMTTSE
ncbi:MAG: hypothetical protein Q4P11_07410 [Methanobrevibacter sp.]|nr:hypothetical protein [Methanobrevibacter sp.]